MLQEAQPTNRMPTTVHEDQSSTPVQEKAVPKLDERFITKIKDREFVLYAGLLDLAHQYGLTKLEVELLQSPSKDNNQVAICRAVAVSGIGKVFTDLGDANPTNVNKMISPHIIRMASTRAKGRVLRDMCNIGFTCLEELGDVDDVISNHGNGNGNGTNGNRRNNGRKPSSSTQTNQATQKPAGNGSGNNTQTNQASNQQPESQPAQSQSNPSQPSSAQPANNDVQSTTASQPANNDSDQSESQPVQPKMSEAQKRAIANLAKRRGLTDVELNAMVHKSYGVALENLTPKDAAIFIRTLQQSA